nr:hypothetical protein [Tanacetum cinerariifolium]
MHKAFSLPVMEFPLPREVPTASEESSHCQKKRDATTHKIALLLMSSSNCQSKSYDSYAKLVPYVTPCILGITEVIKFGDSYEVPANPATTGTSSDGTGKKKGRTVTLTADDMQKRKNDVKARTTLLLSLPDEHQLRFSKNKTTQELWAVILKTFGGNEATKKTKKNILKQQYGNFKADGSETLEQTFNRLQVIFSQLQFMDVEIEHDDLNQKFFTSLAPEWLMHMIVWRNRSDLDTMSLDDLYNHLKVYESEVQKKSKPNSQNMAFISLAKHSRGNEEVNIVSVSTASTNVSTASANNGIDEDDIKEMDIKWNMALLSIRADRFWKKTGKKISIQGTDVTWFDKSKVVHFNSHKMGHFVRECRALRSQDRGRRDNYRQGSKVEEQAPKALMAIDGVGWYWSFMTNAEENHALIADEETLTEFALMAKTNAESETGLPEFKDDTVTDYSRSSPSIESTSDDAQNINPSKVSPSTISPKTFIKFMKANDSITKRIKREFSNVRTPQQNGVAERRNKTLIEAARTMLADAKLPVTFWAEAVNTTCYVQNRPEWSRHVSIVHQTKDLHTANYTQLYDFLKYNQKEVDELKAERLAKIQDPLALMANSNNPYAFPAPHQDQSSFN